MYTNRKYIIIDASEVSSIDFTQVNETSENSLRYSLDESKTFVKFDGSVPSFLVDKTIYNHNQIIDILNGIDWTNETEIE
tara:strand:- start:4796 stop:5035 length:240 start_codon:yes stop_codon:yes gene_type:complete